MVRLISVVRHKWVLLLVALAAVASQTFVACTPSEAEALQGVLRNVDSADGEIIIETKDGKTVTLTISTEAEVEAEGSPTTLEALEPGTSVEVEVADSDHVATAVKARLAKLEGVIIEVHDDQITVESAQGRRVTLTADSQTRIDLDDGFPGAVSDLQAGMRIEVKFDPQTGTAFTIEAEREKAVVKGVLVGVTQEELQIETKSGRRISLSIGDAVEIELEDGLPGIPSDLQEEDRVKVEFDPFTTAAFRVEVEEDEQYEEGEGLVTALDGDALTIELSNGNSLALVLNEQTRIEADEDLPDTRESIAVGQRVKVEFDSNTGIATKVEIEEDEQREDDEEALSEVEGVIIGIEDGVVTLETEEGEGGATFSFSVVDETRILGGDDSPVESPALEPGMEVDVKLDPATGTAVEVEIED